MRIGLSKQSASENEITCTFVVNEMQTIIGNMSRGTKTQPKLHRVKHAEK